MSGQPLPDSELLDVLHEHAGMTQYEASVYLALVRNGKTAVSKLPDKCDVPTGRVYDIVNELHQKGFIEVIDDHPKKAYAVEPAEALAPIQQQLEQTRDDLEDLYQSIEEIEGGISLFKSQATIKKHIETIIDSAEYSLFVLTPYEMLDTIRHELRERSPEIDIYLIVSDLNVDYGAHDAIYLEDELNEVAGHVRGITSSEPFAVVADRKKGLYWTGAATQPISDEDQGFYIMNPEFALLLDRFISESLWQLARPINPDETDSVMDLPAEYTRIRECLSDLKEATQNSPIDAFEIEFEGVDTATGEEVTKRGTLSGYYFTEYDIRATLKVELDGEPNGTPTVVTVGGWKASYEDYRAERLVVRKNEQTTTDAPLDQETLRYLQECRNDFPQTFGEHKFVFGFEGFVDRMRKIKTEDGDRRMQRFDEFKEAIVHIEATHARPELEWEFTSMLPGGKAHIAGVFDTLGYDITLIGNFGDPVHEAFDQRFGKEDIVSVGDPVFVDYITFKDGKLLLSEAGDLDVTWDRLINSIGLEGLLEYIDGSEILSIGAWSRMPSSPNIWDGLRTDIWPQLDSPPETIQVGPGQVQILSQDTVTEGLASLQRLDSVADVLLMANLEQTEALLDKVDDEVTSSTIPQRALDAREATGVSAYVAHTNDESAMATREELLTARAPSLPSGEHLLNSDAHFNAGVLLGQGVGMADGPSLVMGHAVASFFMIHNRPPTSSELRSVIQQYDSESLRLSDEQ